MKKLLSFILALAISVSAILGASVVVGAEANTASLKDTALNLAENITVKMQVSISSPAAGDYALVSVPGNKPAVKTLIADADRYGDDYLFYAEVAVKDFANAIKLEICDKNGNAYCTEYTSAKAYCEKYMELYPDGEFVSLIDALILYADAADRYFDASKSAGAAMTANLSGVPEVTTEGEMPDGIYHRGATLVLESETTVRHYFVIEEGKYPENYRFFVDLDNDRRMEANEILSAKKKVNSEGVAVYYVDIDGISPNDLDTPYTLGVVGAADGKEYFCSYSALNYLKSKNTTTNAKLKNLVATLYAYNVEASQLTGQINFDANGGSEVESQTYEYGVETPIIATTTYKDYSFMGWYDENGIKHESVSASQVGALNLKARWEKTLSVTNSATTNDAVKTHNLCLSHKDTDGDKKCNTCNYCIDSVACQTDANGQNASSNKKTCSICGKVYSKSLGVGAFSSNDYSQTIANGITLSNGATPVVMAASNIGSTYFQFGANDKVSDTLYSSLFDAESGKQIRNALTMKIDLGVPTEAQTADAFGDLKNTSVDLEAPVLMVFQTRLTYNNGSKTYDATLVTFKDGKVYLGSNTTNAIATLPVGSLAKYSVVVDFSDVIPGDNTADNVTVYVYENDKMVGSGVISTQYDLSSTSSYIGRLRTSGKGIIMYDNIAFTMDDNIVRYENCTDKTTLENATPTYTYGNSTTLPSDAERDGYHFLGWFADEALTQPIGDVPAGSVGVFTAYAKWEKAVFSEGFGGSSFAVTKHGKSTLTSLGDGTALWYTSASNSYINYGKSGIKDSKSNVFTFRFSFAPYNNESINQSEIIMQTVRGTKDDGSEDFVSLKLVQIKADGVYAPDGTKLMNLSEGFTTVQIVIDFEKEFFAVLDGNDTVLYITSVPTPSGLESPMDWKTYNRANNSVRWHSTNGAGNTVVDLFEVYEKDVTGIFG